MGMRSLFQNEDNVNLYDQQFYDYCNHIKDTEYKDDRLRGDTYSTAGEIVKWYDANRIDGKLPAFSFACFDNWKTQGYWYGEFCSTIKAMGSFLKGDDHGTAQFIYEEGQPFNFQLDYEKKEVYVEYVPLEWKTMRFNEKIPEIPKEILKVMEQSDVEEAI